MNLFVPHKHYLPSPEKNSSARPTGHSSTPPKEGYNLDASGSVPCSPLTIPSPSLRRDLLDFCTQQTNFPNSQPSPLNLNHHPRFSPRSRADASLSSPASESLRHEVPSVSALFQLNSPALADAPSESCIVGHHDVTDAATGRTISDAPALSFESAVHNLADGVLSSTKKHLAFNVNFSIFNAVKVMLIKIIPFAGVVINRARCSGSPGAYVCSAGRRERCRCLEAIGASHRRQVSP